MSPGPCISPPGIVGPHFYNRPASYISSKTQKDMIYLENKTDAQAAFIPRNGDTPGGDITLTLTSTVDLSTPLAVEVLDLNISRLYYDVAFRLPEGIADGEYRYRLTAGGQILSDGLMVVGAAPRGEAPGVKQYVKETIYQQYNG